MIWVIALLSAAIVRCQNINIGNQTLDLADLKLNVDDLDVDFGNLIVDIGDPVGTSRIPPPTLRKSYDYIVVGAGSSG
jgi:hypothetical protein